MALSSMPKARVVEQLFSASETITPLEIDLAAFDAFFEQRPQPPYREFKKIITENNHLKFKLNKAWLERLCNPSEELNERMTLFWANVFVCKDFVVPYVQQFNNTLRKNALGNFREFVKAISKEPAMIKYLNTNKNKKDHPNENFARELMELFTIGVGNYSETDIKEAARAFTGYGFRLNGSFYQNPVQHDDGTKEFMGRSGEFDGEDIINIICDEKACAQFICTKLYTYFVNEKADKERIDELVAIFYPAYEIRPLMAHLFMSDWFYADKNIGSKIKSPVDLLTSIYRIVPFRFKEDKEHLYIQRITGQVLFGPPNVAGWQGGRNWINTNTLMIRLKLPSVFLGDGFVPSTGIQFKTRGRSFGDRLKIEKNWQSFDQQYGRLSRSELINAVCSPELQEGSVRMLVADDHISQRDFGLQLMSLPEFQLT
jgi:uncharacterized protein (DUF1800 family)